MYWGRYAWVWCVIVCVCTFLVVPLSSVASRLNLILLHSKKLEGGFIYHIMLLYYIILIVFVLEYVNKDLLQL